MKIRLLLYSFLLLLLVGCGSQPDSSGKIYDINIQKAKKELYTQLDVLISEDGENHEAYYRRSRLFYDDSKFAQAQKDITIALKFEPNNQVYLAQLAKIYFALNDYSKAYRLLGKVNNEQKTTELQKIELIAGVKSGKLNDTKSIAAAMKGLKLDKGQEYYLLGVVAWDKKDTLATKKNLELAYENGENSEDVLLTLIKTYNKEDEQNKVLNLLEEASVRFESKHARILLANYYLRNKLKEEEDSIYKIMLKETPSDAEILVRRARLLNSQNKHTEIVELLENDFEKTKTMEDDFILANAYFHLRENDKAAQMYVLLEPLDTTGQLSRNVKAIAWRRGQEKKRNLPDSLRTIAKDSVNSTPKIKR